MGVTIDDLLKHPKRIDLIAYDIWTHFKAYAKPDGFKAQIVAVDREAIILYKRALDRVIADDLLKSGLSEDAARRQASVMSACVYSPSQEDGKPSEDAHVQALRNDLKAQYLDADAETAAKRAFEKRGANPQFLIVCDKLLTGFDAPLESVMYLDKPLKEHGLLQAIARTNRVADAKKRNGLIVDFIGVSSNLEAALETYRADDVRNAMRNLDDLRSELRAAHAAVLQTMRGLKRNADKRSRDDWKAEFDAFVNLLKTEDQWFTFKGKARDFIAMYEAVSPDPTVLEFTADLKWVATFLRYGTQVFEKREAFDQNTYSRKIRDMLAEHLDATGLSVTVKLRHITDPGFWDDFDSDAKTEDDLKTAAIRKTTELRKEVTERIGQNPHQYGKFSDRLRELLEKLDDAQLSWADKLRVAEQLARDLDAEGKAHEGSGLSPGAYGILQVLKSFEAEQGADELARRIETLYAEAPHHWQEKDGLRKSLRQQVRSLVHQSGLESLKELPQEIEEFALNHFAKL